MDKKENVHRVLEDVTDGCWVRVWPRNSPDQSIVGQASLKNGGIEVCGQFFEPENVGVSVYRNSIKAAKGFNRLFPVGTPVGYASEHGVMRVTVDASALASVATTGEVEVAANLSGIWCDINAVRPLSEVNLEDHTAAHAEVVAFNERYECGDWVSYVTEDGYSVLAGTVAGPAAVRSGESRVYIANEIGPVLTTNVREKLVPFNQEQTPAVETPAEAPRPIKYDHLELFGADVQRKRIELAKALFREMAYIDLIRKEYDPRWLYAELQGDLGDELLETVGVECLGDNLQIALAGMSMEDRPDLSLSDLQATHRATPPPVHLTFVSTDKDGTLIAENG